MTRNFWLLTVGQAVNILGTSFGTLAQGWVVYGLTGSKLAMGSLYLAAMLPEIALRLLGAPMVDRWNRVRLMVALDTIQTITYGVLPVLVLSGRLQLWQLYAFAMLAGAARALYTPTYMALIPGLVPPEQLIRANSVGQSVVSGISMVGPALAGLLVAVTGPVPALAIDAVSYGLSALVLFSLPRALGTVQQAPVRRDGYLAQVTEGFRFFWQMPSLLVLVLSVAILNLGTAAVTSLAVPLVAELLKGGAREVGLFSSAMPVGVFLGTVAVGWFGAVKRRSVFLMTCVLLIGVATGATSLTGGHLLWAIGLWGLAGVGIGLFNPVSAAIYHQVVPDQLRGRVQAVRLTLAWGAMPLGGFLGGLVSTRAGFPTMLAWVGIQTVAVAVIALLLPVTRTIDGDLTPPAARKCCVEQLA
ncbi:MAG TPA: MFS transporter [Symbiobacteriaceae bacterium]|nr:MFS transporter [Symbiobacteriaceae bacterium]